MNREINNVPRSGILRAIGSKSEIQRYLIAAALADEKTEIDNFFLSGDTLNAVKCIRACFADVDIKDGICTVTPFENKRYSAEFDVGESATLFRILLPVCALRGGEYRFTLGESLAKRPHTPLYEQLKKNGAEIKQTGSRVTVSGKASASVFVIPTDVTSQYISGMLTAMPESDDNIILHKAGKVSSKPYIDLTLKTLESFGIKVITRSCGYFINREEKYVSPKKISVGGDWSNAAFFLAMGALGGGGITVTGLDLQSVQGDRKILDILTSFGAEVTVEENSVTVKRKELSPIRIKADNFPDLVPIIAVLACGTSGETVISGTGRLKYKESDRVAGVKKLISSLGGNVKAGQNSITVYGTGSLKGGTAETNGDHRMIMAASAASVICKEKVTVTDAEGVNKSYPGFFEIFDSLGE